MLVFSFSHLSAKGFVFRDYRNSPTFVSAKGSELQVPVPDFATCRFQASPYLQKTFDSQKGNLFGTFNRTNSALLILPLCGVLCACWRETSQAITQRLTDEKW